ncbi:hypothetical protein ACFS32_19810 [Novosphingobium pokkalii]|uniref:hypothetical protein n=1 Tax=Novosphingobium pokkalii TaxID=1770194 RepID=UPI003627E704
MAGGLLALHDPRDAADRSVPAIEVPPNFITIRANACAPVHLPKERILPAWPMDHANAAL